MNIKNLNARTKVFVGLAITYILGLNVPAVKDKVIPLLANHPHWSSTVGGVLFIVSLLQKPGVQEALGLKEETTTTTIVPLDPSTVASGEITSSTTKTV